MPAENKYLVFLQFANVFSDFHPVYWVMILSDIPMNFDFNGAVDLVEWAEYF